jgi:hypothetical protein
VTLPDPAIWARFVEALPPILQREWKLAALHEAAGGISWDGRTGWQALISPDLLRLMEVAEAAGVWAPPVPDTSGDDPLRAQPARNTVG